MADQSVQTKPLLTAVAGRADPTAQQPHSRRSLIRQFLHSLTAASAAFPPSNDFESAPPLEANPRPRTRSVAKSVYENRTPSRINFPFACTAFAWRTSPRTPSRFSPPMQAEPIPRRSKPIRADSLMVRSDATEYRTALALIRLRLSAPSEPACREKLLLECAPRISHPGSGTSIRYSRSAANAQA
jgi:hypothetical protein